MGWGVRVTSSPSRKSGSEATRWMLWSDNKQVPILDYYMHWHIRKIAKRYIRIMTALYSIQLRMKNKFKF